MPLTIKYIGIEFNNTTAVVDVPCDSCLEDAPTQEIPAEQNCGEAISIYLCKECLLQLASELP